MMNQNRSLRLLLSSAPLAIALCAQAAVTPGIDASRYKETVRYLASDDLKGRGTGTPGLEKAAKYIAREFKKAGLQPAGVPSPGRDFFQRFDVTTDAKLGKGNHLSIAENGKRKSFDVQKDYQPFNFSGNGKASGPVVFVGYGITAPEYNYDDYQGVDVKDKVVLILRHEPQEFDEKSVFAGKVYTRHATVDSKAINAKFHGAKGVLFVNDQENHTGDPDQLDKFQKTVGPGMTSIPFVQVRHEVAGQWLASAGKSLKEWITEVDKDLKPRPLPLPAGLTAEIATDVRRETRRVPNVCGYLPGQTDEYVVVGAHYDHLGMGDQSSLAPSMAGKAIHYGADDNASGAAGLLELARYFGKQPKMKRGVLFLAFSGEEMGLLGSSWYVNHPPLPVDKAVAMINMDMIGRIKDQKVFLGGVATGDSLKALVEEISPKYSLKSDLSEQGGYGSSDHTSFTSKQVPVLFFFSGLHADYHKPSDTWDKINAESAAEMLSMVAEVSTRLATQEARPKFVRTAAPRPQAMASASMSGYGPYFGSIPDMSDVAGGFRISDVRDGSPAQKAGLKGGDIIFEFGGKPVANLMEFTYALRAFKPGDEVLVKWKRDGQTMEGKTTLSTRK
jgi:hypothetical protein